ncbi:MAG TPA: hypothetical protein VEX13_05025 [Chloroflexia bacterium]|nr:hypothetical protein [Chloroflexia bacterium]
MNKDEAAARRTLTIVGGISLSAVLVSIIFGIRGEQTLAAVFLGLSIVGAAITVAAYRRYTTLRSQRWQRELTDSEEKLNRAFEEEEQKTLDA